MVNVLKWLDHFWPPIFAAICVALLWSCMFFGYQVGHKSAKAVGDKALAELRLQHAEQALRVATESRVQLLQQVERANQAEALLFEQQALHARDKQQLQERIAHVTTRYRPAPAAEPVGIPHCVFTAGWLRDFNLALGAGLPTTTAGIATSGTAQAAWPAPGADTELLESGVTQADLLAYAADYGQWARDLVSQVSGLLQVREACTP